MTTETRKQEPAGGDGLLAIIAATIVVVVTVEALFLAFTSWWLMGLVLALVVAAAKGVSTALVQLIDHDTPVPSLHPRSEPEPARARRDVSRPATPVRGRGTATLSS
jgi:hypothetical protein